MSRVARPRENGAPARRRRALYAKGPRLATRAGLDAFEEPAAVHPYQRAGALDLAAALVADELDPGLVAVHRAAGDALDLRREELGHGEHFVDLPGLLRLLDAGAAFGMAVFGHGVDVARERCVHHRAQHLAGLAAVG